MMKNNKLLSYIVMLSVVMTLVNIYKAPSVKAVSYSIQDAETSDSTNTAQPEENTENTAEPIYTADIVSTATPIPTPTEEPEVIPLAGACGKNASFIFDVDSGVLTITGKGRIAYPGDYDDEYLPYTIRGHLKEAVVGEGITDIAEEFFQSSPHLRKVTLPSTLKTIEPYAFSDCYELSDMTIPKSVTSIGKWAITFTLLKSISLPDKIKSLGAGALSDNKYLTSITFPKNITTIPRDVLNSCSSLKKVVFRGKVKKISPYAFSGCYDLASIKLPSTLKTIEHYALNDVRSLKKITIPKSVKTIRQDTFANNYALRKVINKSSKKINLKKTGAGLTWKVGKKTVKKLPAKKTAKATAKKYKITYDLSGGKAEGTLIKKYTWGQSSVVLPKVKKDGYKYAYWYYGDNNILTDDYFFRTLRYPTGGDIELKVYFCDASAASIDGKLKISASSRKNLPDRNHQFVLVEYADNKDMIDANYVYLDDYNNIGKSITHHTDGDDDTVYISDVNKGMTYYIKFRIITDVDPDYYSDGTYDEFFKENGSRRAQGVETFYETQITI